MVFLPWRKNGGRRGQRLERFMGIFYVVGGGSMVAGLTHVVDKISLVYMDDPGLGPQI
jgi:hypothetical protein